MIFSKIAVARKLGLRGASTALLLLFLQGCIAKKRIVDQIGLTESLCVDGLVANLDASRCVTFYVGEKTDLGLVTVRCVYAKDKSLWTESRFYIARNGYTFRSMEAVRPMCQDGSSIVYVAVKD